MSAGSCAAAMAVSNPAPAVSNPAPTPCVLTAATNCAACVLAGCAWCSTPGVCTADTPGACLAGATAHVGAWLTPATHQRRTCGGGCTGLGCAAGTAAALEAQAAYASYTPPPPLGGGAVPNQAAKRSSVPFVCAPYELATNVTLVSASSSLNPTQGLYLPSKAFDGLSNINNPYANVWIAEQGFPQWLAYDFQRPQVRGRFHR
jgi:hypothetical protein